MSSSSLSFKPSLLLIPLLIATAFGVNGIAQEGHPEDLEEPRTVGRFTLNGPVPEEDPEEFGFNSGFSNSHQQHIPMSRQWSPRIAKPVSMGINQRRKKECGFPVLARRLFGPVLKRAEHHFANSEEEVKEKIKEEDNAVVRVKRNDITESHSGGCMAKRQWIDMGSDYYPRYVKSYSCSSTTCDRGFGTLGECKAKHYTTKVLKRITPADTTSEEDCDHSLPESLRFDWKLISVTVTTCCDCVSPSTSVFRLR